MEGSPTTIAPLLLRNLLTSLFIYADKPLIFLAEKYKLLELLRYILVSGFLFFLRLLPSLFPSLDPSEENRNYPFKPAKGETHAPINGGYAGGGGGSGVARALSQLLTIVNDIPVSSRKYEVVRSLAERLIDENLLEGNEALREVNCTVLSAAFSRTLNQLEAAMLAQSRSRGGEANGGGGGDVTVVPRVGDYCHKLGRFIRAVKYYGDVVWQRRKSSYELTRSGSSAEKLAAELLWLAQKMAACGGADEAVCKWASASHLAWLSLSAEPRLQGSLVKVSAFLIRQAKSLGEGEDDREESARDQQRQTKMKLLMSWLPLLCRGSNGTDTPVLSISERAELERVLERMIETLEEEEEQEKVLSIWLHHFTHCPSSDWPNLRDCYTRWFDASRRLMLLQ